VIRAKREKGMNLDDNYGKIFNEEREKAKV